SRRSCSRGLLGCHSHVRVPGYIRSFGLGRSERRCRAWGLLFLATPAVVISVDRMLGDSVLAALTVAFVIQSERPFSAVLWLVLACAALTRVTGALLAIGYASLAVFQRRPRDVALAAAP